jgi:hypothetical protein
MTYTPRSRFVGNETFTYRVFDGTVSVEATVRVIVRPMIPSGARTEDNAGPKPSP